MRTLIIPDVHGRRFWEKPCEDITEYDHVVFLGDYFDPYGTVADNENYSVERMLENARHIKELRDNYPEKVTLLFGNHDYHYISNDFRRFAGSTRKRIGKDADDICDMLSQFHGVLADEIVNNGQRVLFTHAGMNYVWYDENKDLIDLNNLEKTLNALPDTEDGMEALYWVGRIRGGFYPSGSILWSDLHEMIKSEDENFNEIYQIFGHTQVEKERINDRYSCVDADKCFILDDENKLTAIE